MNYQSSGIYTDLYQLAMGQSYFLNGQYQQRVAFDYFYRSIPFNGGYLVFAGLADVLKNIQTLHFAPDEIEFLREKGFQEPFLKHLENFKFKGHIYAVREGDLVFPNAPIVHVEGSMLETQLVETMLLNTLNFQSLIATKAARIRFVAKDKILSEFGLRRAQGPGGVMASRASIVGGFDSTSNVYAAKAYGLIPAGTMAHSYIQMHEDERAAFRDFANTNPHNCTLLVDTYDTLKSGVPNAIKIAHEMEKRGQRLQAIRLDSGDLSYLARKSREQLDKAGLPYVKIAASNQIDEYVVRSLMQQEAPIDIFGIGTTLVTGQPNAALGGVYKLVMANGKPRIKISENIKKTTLPGSKQVYRLLDEDGNFKGFDALSQENEGFPDRITDPFDDRKSLQTKGITSEALLQPVMKNGEIVTIEEDVEKIKTYSTRRLALLPPEYKRFENAHIYKVGISDKTQEIRHALRKKYLSFSSVNTWESQ